MPTVEEVWKDPEFHGLPHTEKIKVMQQVDPDFAGLPKNEQSKAVAMMQRNTPFEAIPKESAEALKSRFLAQETGKPYMTAMHTATPVQRRGQQQGTDTRRISYTPTGYTPNVPATTLGGIAKNVAQDIIEAPLQPVLALRELAGAPDTGAAALQMGKELVKTPLGFVPFLAEPVTGKPALENWATHPGYGLMTAYGAKKLGGAGIAKGKSVLAERALTKAPDKLNQIITEGIEKGIRPSVEGKSTFSQTSAYAEKAQNAVKSILDNKDKLQLTDEFGEVTTQLPKNLKQFSQAIEQTKGKIFEQYNEMASRAGQQGATIELTPISNELNVVANSKVLERVAPDVAAYAKKRANAFSGGAKAYPELGGKQNVFTATEAQEAVKALNNSLEAFYKNPSYETASRASIDSLVVNHIRKSLDDVIEKSVAPGYQDLKRQYGSLKSIEKDVNRRAVVDARKNIKGLIDFSDIFSGSQVVNGIMSMNPAVVTTGISAKIISALYKMKNDPNRIVSKMFTKAEKLHTPSPKTELPPLNLPVGTPPPPMQPRVPLNLPVGTPPPPMQPRVPLNLPVGTPGAETFYDPLIGRNIPRKQ